MKKILVIGSGGAGKSTIAKKLSKKLNLPLINLDQFYWKPEWIPTSKEKWRNKVAELVKKDEWIIDGNYKSTFNIRFPACDTIIWLDINRFVCFWRIWKRRVFKNRDDYIGGCDEKIDYKFFKWVLWDYPKKSRPKTLIYLKKYHNKKIIIIRSKKDLKVLNFPTLPSH